MSPPTCTDVNIIPTFISTDLVTPGRRNRETLPAIAVHAKNGEDSKLWGQETKPITSGELAYHHFKPSHLLTNNVVVTHRHYGNRISCLEAKQQPYALTTLLMSKCRLNDQRMPPPFHSHLLQEHFIAEPCPPHLRNSYFSHRCKYQVFPTNGVDLLDAARVPKQSSNKNLLSVNNTKALAKLHSNLYDTTSYQQNFGKINDQVNKARKSDEQTSKKKCNCKPCDCKKNESVLRKESPRLLHRRSMDKYTSASKKKYTWPCWPPGENNITNNPPGYPKIILPKYVFHTKLVKNEEEHQCACACKTLELPSDLTDDLNDESKQDVPAVENPQPAIVNNSDKSSGMAKEKMDIPNVCESEATKEVTDKKEELKHLNDQVKRPDLNEELYSLIVSKAPPRFPYERGFKTEAHLKYHEKFKDPLPDLRDATTEGRRHHYCGINIHLFRG